MTFNINDWKRYDCEGSPVYFNSKEPDWFAPNSAGDRLLKDMAQGKNIENDFFTQRFIRGRGQTDRFAPPDDISPWPSGLTGWPIPLPP